VYFWVQVGLHLRYDFACDEDIFSALNFYLQKNAPTTKLFERDEREVADEIRDHYWHMIDTQVYN
jgi:hypothetical protein